MELTRREKIYLDRYKQGTMTKNDFDEYLKRGMITQEFYDFVINNVE